MPSVWSLLGGEKGDCSAYAVESVFCISVVPMLASDKTHGDNYEQGSTDDNVHARTVQNSKPAARNQLRYYWSSSGDAVQLVGFAISEITVLERTGRNWL